LLKHKKASPLMRPSHRIFEREIEYDNETRTFSARCAICGKTETKKKRWFRSRDGTIRLLRLEFDFCETCNRWVCEDCFLIDDGVGAIGICAECADTQGITGYTNAQFEAAWPELHSKPAQGGKSGMDR
jgi:hypothetical protein